mmetsp:Transcript_14843/g.39777  ORF Transcript_14843/g.39777 Transcript_14843/m.39777 type:complete len:83 (-) Transcript_14843:1379-1627(-)
MSSSTASHSCIACGKNALMMCSRCSATWYCSPACQVANWKQHKPAFGPSADSELEMLLEETSTLPASFPSLLRGEMLETRYV